MRRERLRTRMSAVLRDAAIDTGRFVLVLVLLAAASLLSILLAALAYGLFFVTGGTEPLLTTITVGIRSTTLTLDSFTDSQSSFYFMSVYSALFMGAVSYWAYQQIISGLGRLRRWYQREIAMQQLR